MSAIAREAGALLLPYFHQGLKIEYKGDADLVTAADRAAETLIRERISNEFPSHDVLGEEQGLNDQGSDYRWYVDPLDGTTNFAHGYPVFCVSLALERRGPERARRIAGVVYDPTRDELFTAELGTGAHLNGKPIHVSKATQLKECLPLKSFTYFAEKVGYKDVPAAEPKREATWAGLRASYIAALDHKILDGAMTESTKTNYVQSLKAFDEVVPAAGSIQSAVRIAPARMAELVAAEWVDVC